MALILNSTVNAFLLSHSEYISKIFKSVKIESQSYSYKLTPKLFAIKNKKNKINNKRLYKCDDILEESGMIKEMYSNFYENIPSSVKENVNQDDIESATVREYSKKLFELTQFDHNGLKGGNNSDDALKCLIQDECFLLPPKSRFLCGCVKEQCKALAGNKYDVVIADPPWWNKYIRRLKTANNKMSYSMMYNEDIASIPVKELFAENCLIVIWCTNATSNIDAVKNLIFPEWGITYLATWYWLKLTVDLEPICNFSSGCKKQPYERLIIGSVGEVKKIPDKLLFASVPSALHSHKPPLLDLLQKFTDIKDPEVLELFARYMLPNTTSVGYEPLKWQHISLYEML